MGKKLSFYGPTEILDFLLRLNLVKSPDRLTHYINQESVSRWSLIILPDRKIWHAQITREGVPKFFAVFDAEEERPIKDFDYSAYTALDSLFTGLRYYSDPHVAISRSVHESKHISLASEVISGSRWDDLRPARPIDFVGRDREINLLLQMIEDTRRISTSPHTFGISAPSGWGKSSLALKICDLINNTLDNSFAVSIDCRSAISTSFVSEAIILAFKMAAKAKGITEGEEILISDAAMPLSGIRFEEVFDSMDKKGQKLIIVFDQFEEIFSKEDLLETFEIIKNISYFIDSNNIPVILGIVWKTDISLPQGHPAYHMWHSNSDRRLNIKLKPLDKTESAKMIKNAQKGRQQSLKKQISAKIIDQSQGLPWLIKKLVLHIFNNIDSGTTQFDLLERQLDVKNLFDQDLAELQREHVQCLKFIAHNSPTPVIDVHESFNKDIVNFLIQKNLIIKSGSNYVIYWDIFRDYLTDDKLPSISWNRAFQRDHNASLRALQVIDTQGPISTKDVASTLGLTLKVFYNILTDLIALNLVDSSRDGLLYLPSHMSPLDVKQVAEMARQKLRYHNLNNIIEDNMIHGVGYSFEDFKYFFEIMSDASQNFSKRTIDQYALSMLKWFTFSGLLEEKKNLIYLPTGYGSQFARHYDARKILSGVFLGNSSPLKAFNLFKRLNSDHITREDAETDGLRNSLQDLIALDLVICDDEGFTAAMELNGDVEIFEAFKQAVVDQETFQFASSHTREGKSKLEIGRALASMHNTVWEDTSCMRYVNGILRYNEWITENSIPQADRLL